MAVYSRAGHGTAWQCTARQGMARHGSVQHGRVWHGTAVYSTAGQGTARQGRVWQDDRHTAAGLFFKAWHSMALNGSARRGTYQAAVWAGSSSAGGRSSCRNGREVSLKKPAAPTPRNPISRCRRPGWCFLGLKPALPPRTHTQDIAGPEEVFFVWACVCWV